MAKRLFDPQLYFANVDPRAEKICTYLASYPWFGLQGIPTYESSIQNQKEWSAQVRRDIGSRWPRSAPKDPSVIENGLRECIDYQIRNGYEGIILPSPLTIDPSTSYDEELMWLDEGIRVARELNSDLPLYGTIALCDVCVRYIAPNENRLLEQIADSISARDVDGAYLVLEQSSEPNDTRHCADVRSLHSMLTLVHYLSKDAGLKVVVNFFGPFGLALEAAGAKIWASAWYKSLYRLRLADAITTGRAYPSFWNYKTTLDIHLENDFDRISQNGLLDHIEDITPVSQGLFEAVSAGVPTREVLAWEYRPSNVTATREHFFHSLIRAETLHSSQNFYARMDFVQDWLEGANRIKNEIVSSLGHELKTKVQHVDAWRQAFLNYRADQRV